MNIRDLAERLDDLRYRYERDPQRMREESDKLLADFLDDMAPMAGEAFRKLAQEAEHAA